MHVILCVLRSNKAFFYVRFYCFSEIERKSFDLMYQGYCSISKKTASLETVSGFVG